MNRKVLFVVVSFFVGFCLAADVDDPPPTPPADLHQRTVEFVTPSVVTTTQTFTQDKATWLRLVFAPTSSAPLLRLTSVEDGAQQHLNTKTLAQWEYASAFFNGDSIKLEVLDPEDGNTISVVGLIYGEVPPQKNDTGLQTLCGTTDTRRPTFPNWDPRSGRYMGNGGCTAWLINDRRGCFLTAGHCTGTGSVQFRVPESGSDGRLVHPAPRYQYPIDSSSIQFNNGGTGNDWKYMGAYANSETGLTPIQDQRSSYTLAQRPQTPSALWIYGYGTGSGRANQAQKEARGGNVNLSGNRLTYRVDTTGGDSGSGVEDTTGTAYAIHTHGGCTATGGSNSGTFLFLGALQTALNNPRGVCA